MPSDEFGGFERVSDAQWQLFGVRHSHGKNELHLNRCIRSQKDYIAPRKLSERFKGF